MQSFSTFSFKDFTFDYDTNLATFSYQFDQEIFTEEVSFFSKEKKIRTSIDENIVNNILKHIHIAIGISYYKLSPTAKILVPQRRTPEMLEFRKTFYLNGLGEFMMVNQLSPKNIANFSVSSPLQTQEKSELFSSSGDQSLLFF